MRRHSRTSLIGFWAALLVFGSAFAAVASPATQRVTTEQVASSGLSLTTVDLLGPAREAWDVEGIEFSVQADYQVAFRAQFDFLSDEPSHVAATLLFRPDGDGNRSLAELGLILTDEEWTEFERRDELASHAGEIRSLLAGRSLDNEEDLRFGDLYGGIWQDQADGGVLRLYVTDLSAVDTAVLIAVVPRGDDDLKIREVTYSFDELWDFHAKVGAMLFERKVPGESATIDIDTNTVLIRSSEKFEFKGVPEDAVSFEAIDPDVPPMVDAGLPGTTHSTATLQSGLEIRVWDDNRSSVYDRRCTWGFTGHTASYNYLVTAGHCVSKPGNVDLWSGYTDWQQDGELSAPWRGNHRFTYMSNSSRYDAARISSSYANTNCYHQGNVDCGTRILKRFSLYGHLVGQTVCASLGKCVGVAVIHRGVVRVIPRVVPVGI